MPTMKIKKASIQDFKERDFKEVQYGGEPFSKISISVPDDLRALVECRAFDLHLNVSQYIRLLVDQDLKPSAQDCAGNVVNTLNTE
jgi:hypothetical protein